jgi:vacuolar-type H+-ATPase subunit H
MPQAHLRATDLAQKNVAAECVLREAEAKGGAQKLLTQADAEAKAQANTLLTQVDAEAQANAKKVLAEANNTTKMQVCDVHASHAPDLRKSGVALCK